MSINEKITTIILTFNEEKHIRRCVESAKKYSKYIFIVDSFSKDKTVDIAKSLGVQVLQNQFINYSKQFSWALKNINIKTDWTLRLDADEYLEDKLIEELNQKLDNLPKDIVGINFKRKHIFLNKWIRFGGRFPLVLLRLWRTGKGYIEDRWMDEHIIINEGKTITFKECFNDHNLNNLSFFTAKHNWYADREAIDVLADRLNLIDQKNDIKFKNSSIKTNSTRIMKNFIYKKLPFSIGPLLYFFYRYFILLGFVDGKEGLIYHFLQGFWYRFLVDSKIIEYTKEIKNIETNEGKLKKLSSLTNLKLI
tara:strand:+ start:636 stop:1559 length:924 start_codon:yes stop_codon:yes gene_type:complete